MQVGAGVREGRQERVHHGRGGHRQELPHPEDHRCAAAGPDLRHRQHRGGRLPGTDYTGSLCYTITEYRVIVTVVSCYGYGCLLSPWCHVPGHSAG